MSENETQESGGSGELTRKELVTRAGQVGAGIVVGGALVGPAAAATGGRRAPTPKRGGKLTFALEQDPVFLAPFGQILTSGHWGKEPIYDSLLEWDRKLEVQPALAESYTTPNDTTYVFKLRRGVRFHNGKEMTAEDVKYSFDLQAAPPLPGSVAVLGLFPAIDRVEIVNKYSVRILMKRPDASLIGYLAWGRYSPIVPVDLYKQINPVTQAIGTGPFRLETFIPNDRVDLVRNPRFWKRGQPYLDALTLKTLPDEQARVAAIRSGAIDGATFLYDAARNLASDRNLNVLRGPTAAFRELQMTLKGERKPWHDKRVRQAVSAALNRQDMTFRVYGGNGRPSGHIPPGYGPYPYPVADLRNNYLKFDLTKARALMAAAGQRNGFSVTMSTFSTPQDFPALASVIKSQLAQIGIEVRIEAQEPGTFAANNGRGNFEWDLTARGMRGDPNGYVAEFGPASPAYKAWYEGGWDRPDLTRLIERGIATVNQRQRTAIYRQIQRILFDEMVQVPLVSVNKFQVFRKPVKNMYVAFTDFNTGLRSAWLDR